MKHPDLHLGNKSYISSTPQIIKALNNGIGKVIVGKYCSLSFGLVFLLDSNHYKDKVTTYPMSNLGEYPKAPRGPYLKGNITIGNDVWLAYGVSVAAGVSIGDGAIVATNSHVVKDVPPYAIVGGNPAKLISYRFSQEIINELLRIKWWDWPNQRVVEWADLIGSKDIQRFIDKCRENGL